MTTARNGGSSQERGHLRLRPIEPEATPGLLRQHERRSVGRNRRQLRSQSYLALGNALSSKGNYKDAIHHYDSAIKLDPQNPVARNNLGVAYLGMGKDKEGLESLKYAATLGPQAGEIHVNLARAYLRLRNKDAALTEYGVLKTIDSALAKIVYAEIFHQRILKVRD